MPSNTCEQNTRWQVHCVLRQADNALILAQRLSEWCGHGPVLEEDIAMANIGLDLLGQARLLLTLAGELEGLGRTEDQLAYFRDEHEFFNWTALELPNAMTGDAKHQDYEVTLVRNMLYSAWALAYWSAVTQSKQPDLAAVAAKAIKETHAHWRHAAQWTIRLGDGTDLSQQKMQAALEKIWPLTNEWFTDDALDIAAATAQWLPQPSSLKNQWLSSVSKVLNEAQLKQPANSEYVSKGKQGEHSEHLSYLLAEMQSLARAHPGVTW
jgi:ring-1,2-phenylacetyl-CoA epoxidase subunit PaaC